MAPRSLVFGCSALLLSALACKRAEKTPQPGAPAVSTASAPASVPVGAASAPAATAGVDELATSVGTVRFHPVHHATLYLDVAGKIVWLDPAGDKTPAEPKADVILITDIHGDHLDEQAVGRLKRPTTRVLGPASVAEKLPGVERIANGERRDLGFMQVEAVPMYNVKRGPAPGKLFHDKGRGNGYVLVFGDRRVYVSGDTECIPEMKALRAIDVAFVCMNLPYTMPPSEAAECVAAFRPKVLYPYHYRGSEMGELDAKLRGSGVSVRKRDWY
jgi:L-ascorbate metabolism protein UlaG (beta-lactamase superfamily)